MRELVNKWLKNICAGAVAPGLCHLCQAVLDKPDLLLCAACQWNLPVNDVACPGCAAPGTTSEYCPKCLVSKRPVIDGTICVYRYAYPVNKLIQDLKFHGRPDLAGFLGRALAARIKALQQMMPQRLIPVPLHLSRLGQRGYNQSLEIARHVSVQLGIPVDCRGLKRARKTLTQSELPAKQRKQNIRGAFTTSRTLSSMGNHVAIIDDVITTGATVNELARVLKKSGVGRVDVWACARATI